MSLLPPSDPAPDLVCVGASVRAFACSAARAGWRVHAADMFGDRDLLAVVATHAPAGEPYPGSLAGIVASLPPGPWCYTGALENHPDLIATIAAVRPLLGNAAEAVRAVRDPARLAAAVREAGLEFPETLAAPPAAGTAGAFLVKPRGSAGGRGIERWRGQAAAPPRSPRLWQRRIVGRAWSASFACDRRSARLVCHSRQLLGRGWCHAEGFAYSGSILVPPARVPPALAAATDRLGALLAGEFGLAGLVGVDLVIDRRGGVHVIEVNPRPTASMELAERATGVSQAAVHVAACRGAGVPGAEAAAGRSWGKAVLFARHDLRLTAPLDAALDRLAVRWSEGAGRPGLADLPAANSFVAARRPLLTLFAAAADERAVVGRLRRRAALLDRILSSGSRGAAERA